mmetsp:Transcript_20503/g.31110  ORF Transcript_20503/g.31110 Transcript_20503/m.31110 type:complete len:425 (-) Transcript_20503:553-1827(-)|eukprot:CAMPEP_0194103492 /NCGR_PEP_ID=MMETSP0150-20130528/3917_1 /TAXON_ID=122233 /ORGANISM="Chaetoceros debilis, Strain MM31A-1" /LENGTH=424 /DNA_ID=CAMNT_0038790745 /DNA_START=186 /DNA_END=1460 /DNA_ORIENTATION=+
MRIKNYRDCALLAFSSNKYIVLKNAPIWATGNNHRVPSALMMVRPSRKTHEQNQSREGKRVRQDLSHSLKEWGVTGQHEEHGKFRDRTLNEGVLLVSAENTKDSRKVQRGGLSFEHLESDIFPDNIQEAFEYALRADVTNVAPEKCVVISDRLNVEGFGEPFFSRKDKRISARRRRPKSGKKKNESYLMKHDYKGFHRREIDPLRRYSFEQIPKSDYFYQRWFIDERENDLGTFLEAWGACHAIQKEPCFNCGCTDSLRWNGGSGSSWQDIVCIKCGAMYEVKTKASMDKIRSEYYFNNLSSGSFNNYCKIAESRRRDQKMFLVLFPREHTLDKVSGLKRVHPGLITEIANVKPKLFEGSFNPSAETIRFKSRTQMKLHTRDTWFELPVATEINMDDAKKKVFIEFFGKEMFDHLSQDLFYGTP